MTPPQTPVLTSTTHSCPYWYLGGLNIHIETPHLFIIVIFQFSQAKYFCACLFVNKDLLESFAWVSCPSVGLPCYFFFLILRVYAGVKITYSAMMSRFASWLGHWICLQWKMEWSVKCKEIWTELTDRGTRKHFYEKWMAVYVTEGCGQRWKPHCMDL